MKRKILCTVMSVLMLTGTVSAAVPSGSDGMEAETASSVAEAEKSTLYKESPCFRIETVQSEATESSHSGTEFKVINTRTGKTQLRGVPLWEDTADGTYSNSIYVIDDETLLWARDLIGTALAEYWFLKSDGSMEKVETDFQIVAQDSRGRFLVKKDKIPSRSAEFVSVDTYRWLFGIVDRDLKTVLLPFEYDEDPWIDVGDKSKGRGWVPYWRDGYMILKKGGKCGVIDFNLKEVVPFQYDELTNQSFHAARYKKGKSYGAVFLDSGVDLPNRLFPEITPHTVTVFSLDESTCYLYNRYGNLLYQSQSENRVRVERDREPAVVMIHNDEKFEVPSVVRKSSWAEAEIGAARSAGLLPTDVDWLYTYPASRRDFCKLIMQMLEEVRPSVACESELPSHERFWDVSSYEYYDESSIADAAETGILSGFPDGSFRPYAQITRQDAAVMLAKAAELLGVEPQAEPIAFADLEQADAYARDSILEISALQTPDGIRIMSGSAPGRFDPKGTYTVEQAIATVYRLYLTAK